MRRRAFLAGAGAALLLPRAARGQAQAKMPRLGVLRYGAPKDDAGIEPLISGLQSLGYTDGKSISLEYRYAESHADRLPALAAEIAGSAPDMMLALGGDIAPFVRDATKTIPIVFSVSADPVRLGLVASLNRPERNATGVTFLHDELGAKRLQLLKGVVPSLAHVAFLWNPDHLDDDLAFSARAAQSLSVKLLSLPSRTANELAASLAQASKERVDAVYVVTSTLMVNNMARIVQFASEQRLPLIGGWGAWAAAGSLMSYGPDVNLMMRRAATFVDKILKGAKPADLPVEQPTKFQLVVNMKVARALGVTLSPNFLATVDETIE